MAQILPSAPTGRSRDSTATVTRVTPSRTFPELLATRLQTDPGQPLVTAYDDATGERTELSVTTYVNWVSKTANLLTDELGLDAGDTVLLDLPSHWLVPVFLGAAWSAGLTVTDAAYEQHDVVVTGPAGLDRAQGSAPVVACSLRPFAVRFAEALPSGVLDYGLLWPGQSDVFLALTAPSPDTVAWRSQAGAWSHAELLEAAAVSGYEDGVRLLTDVHPAAEHGVPTFLAPLLRGGSLVLLTNAGEDSWSARRRDERASAELRH
jgi:uncharacterized protein (TIGR03089 family)